MSVSDKFDKYVCETCDAVFKNEDVLFIPNPYLMDTNIYICPNCKRVTNLIPKCDVEGCNHVYDYLLVDNDECRRYVCFSHIDEVNKNKDKK